METNSKILKNKGNGDKSSRQKLKIEGNNSKEEIISNFQSDTHDPASVISFGGILENSVDKDQMDRMKEFIRESRKYDGPLESNNEILDLIDSNSNAYHQFNTLTKIKYFYLKHEWTFIAIREFSAIAILIISFLLYSSSLKIENNYHNYNMYFYYPMTFESLVKCTSAGIIIGFIIFLMYRKWVFLEHLIYIFIVYIVLISKNHGSNILNHGKYNLIIFSLCSIVIFLILMSIHMIHKFSRTIKYLYLINAIFSLFLGFIICYIFKDKNEQKYLCDNWGLTLNSTYIENNDNNQKCKMEFPKGICYMDKIFNYFDLTLANKIECKKRDESEYKNFFNNINEQLSDAKIFGFPYTNNIKSVNISNNLEEYIINNLINLEKSNMSSETILDFSTNKYGELKINFTKNESLSNERKKLDKNNNKAESIYDNVLMIFLSSTSRAHFQRAMPKLSKFVSKLMGYEPFPSMTAYQFPKYYNFPSSESNIQSMFYGKGTDDKFINSLKYFKENGFITGQVIDKCEKSNDELETEWDHENFAYLCGPNYNEKENSVYERCLYGEPVSHYMINYTMEFWDKYSDNNKYFRMIFNYGNEPTGNVLKYLDEPLFNMLTHLYNGGKLKNTAIFIVSEQGNRNDGLYNILGSSDFELEKKYGLFIMILDWNEKFKNGNYHPNIINNQNNFVTPYDIYKTNIHIILGNNTYNIENKNKSRDNRGESVLNKLQIDERNCGKDWAFVARFK